MLIGESSPSHFSGTPSRAPARSEIDLVGRIADFKSTLAARTAELKQREAALRNAERATVLPRVSTAYFHPGHYSHEDVWWSKQLGSR